jgi:KUP system potassium uptake protein
MGDGLAMGGSAGGQLRATMVVGALGVVFGDIGTSPIYTLQTLFNPGDPHPVPITDANVYGVVSLIFWSVMVIVTLTYVTLVMRADNDGEGGVMALITLVRKFGGRPGSRVISALSMLGILGAALFFGDSMITPAISVLSAVEGMKVVDPKLASFVLPITVVIIIGLFSVQRRGTAAVGRFFGPVMILWFLVIGACGVRGIAGHPQILRALSPAYALDFMAGHFEIAFFALAAVVLSVTGAEALYADMGHFGRAAITLAWLGLVLPALVLNYFGQAALLLGERNVTDAPFFMLVPGWAQIPMIVLATAATVIASQAVITGAFSVASQAAQLGYAPRLRMNHTSECSAGQIYVPSINGILLVAVLILVFGFRSSAALGYAYGMAVTGTITITTLLFLYLARARWRAPLWLVVIGGGALLTVDLMFLAANLTKLLHGAWLPLLIGLSAFTFMTTWQRGRAVVTANLDRHEGSLSEFVGDLNHRSRPLTRIPGTIVVLTHDHTTVPVWIRRAAGRGGIHVVPEHVIFVVVDTVPLPRVSESQRVTVHDLGNPGDGIIAASLRFGYMDRPDIPRALALLDPLQTEGPVDLEGATYFLSKVDVAAGPNPSMPPWRTRLYLAISHLTPDAVGHFALPAGRTVVIGSRVAI